MKFSMPIIMLARILGLSKSPSLLLAIRGGGVLLPNYRCGYDYKGVEYLPRGQ